MRPLDGYPQPFGYSKGSVFPHAGPTAYNPVVEESPADLPLAGGDRLEAVEAGLKLFDWVSGGYTDSGLFRVDAIPVTPSEDQVGAPATTYILRWVIVATNAEVANGTDLSEEIVRLFALGPK